MVEATLKHLLATERQAAQIVQAAEAEREQWIRQATQAAQAAEQSANLRLPALRADLLAQALVQTEQAVETLRRRQAEHIQEAHAQERQQQAADAAWRLLLGQV